MSARTKLGRYLEPAMWVLVALADGPRRIVQLLDRVRVLDGPMGHGTLFAAVARLEELALVETAIEEGGRRVYRLTEHGVAASRSAAALQVSRGSVP
jgi:DNA-binding PadR family transcriptional regulator